ncbi:LicD family protein [Butyrivibrio sp. MC2013]|uniref:LicD family protein n=1 Tax=Butyrivibrio sp. MC2013 TaxID=1280686 RepID=UPI00041F37FF|nr:LicD family protein [Butyrivibrio sp. MC2013]
MDDELLRKVQLCMLDILKEFKRVCDILELDYHLDSGTLLGAVRHKGFIPWDDDADVGMLRENYEIFISKAPALLDKRFFLQTRESDINYAQSYAKLRMRDTVYVEEITKDSECENGFFIDIFPYDIFPSKAYQRILQSVPYELSKKMMLMKCGYKQWMRHTGPVRYIKHALFIPIEIMAMFYSRDSLIRLYDRVAQRYNGSSSQDRLAFTDSAYGSWILHYDDIRETTELEFEGELFKCPKGYVRYLTDAYGDYMQLPPLEDRVNRHGIVECKFPGED